MNRIDRTFQKSKKEGKTLFIAYIMAGDPSLAQTEKLVPALEASGVNILELGVPFSDPIADGVVNQNAGMRALEAGTTLAGILNSVKKIRLTSQIPMVIFSYLNPILQYGVEAFARDAAAAGIDGILALDLPPEEAKSFVTPFKQAGIKTIFLISPTTPKERIQKIGSLASGFIYYVSRLGVTGVQKNLAEGLPEKLREIKKVCSLPIAVGFGVSEPHHVKQLSGRCDAIVVGSAIVKKIEEKQDVCQFVRTLTKEL